jgi:hypothetical protein
MATPTSLFFRRKFSGKGLRLYALLALTALPLAARGHDFWIEPEKFHVAGGEQVPLRLYVGQQFKGESVLYAPESFERYVYAGPGGERKVPGNLGDDPAGSVSTKEPGLYIVGFHSKKFDITFDSFPKFEEYLTTEGLERNLQVAKKRFSLSNAVLEIYSRCAKSLVKVGDGAGSDRALGFPLELIAETNPYGGQRKFSARLLYRGKPLEGALVVAFTKQSPLDKLKVRTDKDGRAVLDLNKPGVWLINCVHMIPGSLLSRADWESFWASLTFELP